jgi:LAS superfamily LD-carboxypeptidase LdcB
LARTNFQYEKRQKEIARQKKNEEKRLRKLNKDKEDTGSAPEPASEEKSGA